MKNRKNQLLELDRGEKWAWIFFLGLGINYLLWTIVLSYR